jgi:hypothetical protein
LELLRELGRDSSTTFLTPFLPVDLRVDVFVLAICKLKRITYFWLTLVAILIYAIK